MVYTCTMQFVGLSVCLFVWTYSCTRYRPVFTLFIQPDKFHIINMIKQFELYVCEIYCMSRQQCCVHVQLSSIQVKSKSICLQAMAYKSNCHQFKSIPSPYVYQFFEMLLRQNNHLASEVKSKLSEKNKSRCLDLHMILY